MTPSPPSLIECLKFLSDRGECEICSRGSCIPTRLIFSTLIFPASPRMSSRKRCRRSSTATVANARCVPVVRASLRDSFFQQYSFHSLPACPAGNGADVVAQRPWRMRDVFPWFVHPYATHFFNNILSTVSPHVQQETVQT